MATTRWDPFVTQFSISASHRFRQKTKLDRRRTGLTMDPQFYRVHLNESGLWFSAPKSGGPGYVTDGSEFPPQSAPL